MGAESGGARGRVPLVDKISGGRPPRNKDIPVTFSLILIEILHPPTVPKIKWPKSEEKLNFRGRRIWLSMNPPPPPQSKLRGGAPDYV